MNSTYIVFPAKDRVSVQTEDIATPARGEVLCRARCSLISRGTERVCLTGIFDPDTNWAAWTQYPFRPGYSMAAEVIAVGSDVQSWREGDRVVARSPHQQYFTSSPDHLFPIPAGISDQDAAWATLATTAQLGVRRAQPELGERVGVVGMGMLGQLVVQYLAVMGCPQIIAIDRNPARVKLARTHGATHGIASDVDKARAAVELLTQRRQLDAVLDVTGNSRVLSAATALLRPFGKLVLLGDTPTPSQQTLGSHVVAHSLSILGIHALARPLRGSDFYPWGAAEMMSLFFEHLRQGRMRVADLITQRVSPLDALQAYEMLLRDHSAMGVVFDWTRLSPAE